MKELLLQVESFHLSLNCRRFYEDDEAERILTLKNAPGNRVNSATFFQSLSEHERLLQSSSWFQVSDITNVTSAVILIC